MGNTTHKDQADITVKSNVYEITKNLKENQSCVIWHDPNIYSNTNSKYIDELKLLHYELHTFTDWENTVDYVKQFNGSCQIITAGKNGETLVKAVSNMDNVIAVYVFCQNTEFHRIWAKNYPKVALVEDRYFILIENLDKNTKLWQRKNSPLRINLPTYTLVFDDRDKKKMNLLNPYLRGLLDAQDRTQGKHDFLMMIRLNYQDEENIQKFDTTYNNYDMKAILTWYAKESFFYQAINNCLQIGSSDCIQYCRLILNDLESAIKDQFQCKSKQFHGLVYKGTYLSKDEWQRLKANIGNEIETSGFLLTTKIKNLAVDFVQSDITTKALITIIVPNIPVKGEQGFAEMSDFSEFPNEEEILFNINSRFTVISATMQEISGLKCRHLILLHDTQAMRRYVTEKNPIIEVSLTNTKQILCAECRYDIDQNNKSFFFFIDLRQMNHYVCHVCMKKPKITRNLPYLCLDHANRVFLTNERVLKIEGMFIEYGKDLNISLYGSNCRRCKQNLYHYQYRCLQCHNKTWCEKCFKEDVKCMKKHHSIIFEDHPHILWSEKLLKIELEYEVSQEVLLKKPALIRQAEVFFHTQDYQKARFYYEEFLKPIIKKSKEDTAISFNRLGRILDSLGEYNQAADYYLQSIDISKENYGEMHPSLVDLYFNLGNTYKNMGNYQRAVDAYYNSLITGKILYSETDSIIAKIYNSLGVIFQSLGDHEKAEEYHVKCLEALIATYGEKGIETANSYNSLALIYNSTKKYEKAAACYSQLIELKAEILQNDQHPEIMNLYNTLGKLHYKLNDYEKAKDLYLKSLNIAIAIDKENNPALANTYIDLGETSIQLEEYLEAKQYFLKALEIIQIKDEEINQHLASLYSNLGIAHQKLREYSEALKFHLKALEGWKAIYGETHHVTVQSYKHVTDTYKALGDGDKEDYFKFLLES